MKICKKCNISYSDDKKFCRDCGSELIYTISSNSEFSAKKEVLEEELKSDPVNVEILHEYAQLLFENQLFKETVTVCLQILAIDEKDITAKSMLFDTYLKLDDYKEAFVVGKQIISEKSGEISFFEKLSEVAVKLEYWEEAINYLDVILKEQPAHKNTLQRKVKILLDNNNFQAVVEIFKTLYNEGNRDKITIIYVGIGKALEAEYLDAIELLKLVLENENFEKGNTHDNRGLLYFIYSLCKSLSDLTEIERWYSKLNPNFLTLTKIQFDIEVAGAIVQYILRNKLNEISASSTARNKIDGLIRLYLNKFPDSDKSNSEIAEMWYSIGMKQKGFNLLDDAFNSVQKSTELNFKEIKYKQAFNELKELLQKEKKKKKERKLLFRFAVFLIVALIVIFPILLKNTNHKIKLLDKIELGANNDDFTDPRDGKIYKTIKIGEQIWMAENLAYDVGYGCFIYENDLSNLTQHGRLYTFLAAKNACPAGWHLPSKEEWGQLAHYISDQKGPYAKINITSWQGVGKHIKARKGWDNEGNGTDDFRFHALPSGFYYEYGEFGGLGSRCNFWHNAQKEGPYFFQLLMSGSSEFAMGSSDKMNAFSVRCIRDYQDSDEITKNEKSQVIKEFEIKKVYGTGTYRFELKEGEILDHWIQFPKGKLINYSISSPDYNYKIIYSDKDTIKGGADVIIPHKESADIKFLALSDQVITLIITIQ